MEKSFYKPIETPVGTLIGRDAIYLNAMFYDGSKLTLEGSFNGHLASKPTNDDIFYKLTFESVLALKMIELDSLYHLPDNDILGENSCFDEIIQSRWVAELGGKVTSAHKHFYFGTYDDTFEVVCAGYTLETWTTIPLATCRG